MPKKTGNFPAVVLINGSGPQNRNEEAFGHKLFLVISDYLTRHGIAVLRYDKRGIGKSTGHYSGATTSDFAADAEAAFDYLRTRKAINPKKIGLVGHSEGGTIAPMVAAKNKKVDFIVLLAGTGVEGGKVLLKQQELIGKAMGQSDDLLRQSNEINQKIYTLIKNTKDTTELKRKIRKNVKEALVKHPELKQSSGKSDEAIITREIRTYMNPWMREFISLDPAKALQKVSCPVLALDGSHDMQVNADQNLPAIKKALEKGGNSDVTIKKLESLNHLFQKSKTGSHSEYAEIEQTFSPKALKIMTNWILKESKAL